MPRRQPNEKTRGPNTLISRQGVQFKNKQTKEGQRWLRVKTLSMDQFHVIKRLGTGNYGEVRLVKDKATGDLHAMKAFHHTGGPADEAILNGLNNERTLLMEVNSVWVERMFHSVQDTHYHFIILEYIPGGTLAQLLDQEGNLTESQIRFYGAEMLMAINVVHRHGFMHRNIQPNNFLLDQFGHIKLADFGCSLRFLPAETCLRMASEASIKDGKPFLSSKRRDRVQIYQRKTMDTNVGPFNFMAPEVVRKRPKGLISYIKTADPAAMYSFAADFWSFGVCIYSLLFGQMPFVGKDRRELRSVIVNWRKNLSFPVVQPISDEVKDLIKKLLCDEPYRLGFYGCEDIMSHVFFNSIDWLHLRDWPVPVPYESDIEQQQSDASIGPPAFIVDLMRGKDHASSNNVKPPGPNEPYREDRLQSHVDTHPSTAVAAPSQPASTHIPELEIRCESVDSHQNQFPSASTPYVQDDSQPNTSIPSSTSQLSAFIHSCTASEAAMNVSWDEKSTDFSGVQHWLQTAQFDRRPSRLFDQSTDDPVMPTGELCGQSEKEELKKDGEACQNHKGACRTLTEYNRGTTTTLCVNTTQDGRPVSFLIFANIFPHWQKC